MSTSLRNALVLRAGPEAHAAIARDGVRQAMFGSLLGASGGPKWLILAGLDRYLAGTFFRERSTPLALLAGRVELAFARSDARLGALAGRLHGGGRRGLSDLDGAVSLAGGLGMIPVDTVRFEGAAVRFDSAGKCVAANGRVQLSIAAPIAGLDLSRGLSGPLACAGGRAQAALASQSGMERLTLSFDGSGAWRARFAIGVDRDPAMAAALSLLGFKPGPGGFALTASGRFQGGP